MLLAGKNAVVYGAGGSIGSAVSRTFAREGARVFLGGRTLAPLDRVAESISASGGEAETARVDALDERSVDEHADAVAERAGSIDVSFNAIGHGDIHGTPVLEMPFDDFAGPIVSTLRSQFLTARAAARHMVPRGAGVILAVTATTARLAIPEVGGTAVRFGLIESLCQQLAGELGPSGIRVLWLQSTGLPESLADIAFPGYGTGSGSMSLVDLVSWMEDKTLLNRLTTLRELADVAAFVASDRASAMTASGANITCGSVRG